MSFKTFCYSVCTLLFVLICKVIGRISKYKEILNRYNSGSESHANGEKGLKCKGGYRVEPGSGNHPEAGTDEKTPEGEIKRAKLSIKKGRGSPNVDRSPEGLSCRRKLEAALPILLQAVKLDNAGSLEAVGAYKDVVKLFDDAIEILKSKPWKPTRVSVEVRLRSLRDTYRDRADLLLLGFQERVLKRRF
ncbi:hypothetical protein B0J17DRAFT_715656 [Rhizoctonia solani]|nr:hypothetical protein B0J17DRAFT_715656 [Rhizoctonia solani]